jgi:hypothetical protein
MKFAIILGSLFLSTLSLSNSSFADALSARDIANVNEILSSHDCAQIKTLVHSLRDAKTESVTDYLGYTYLVTGTAPSGEFMQITLMERSYNNVGAFGGGGYVTGYWCSIDE